MGSLTLYINGLALCHFVDRDKSWKTFFPKVDKHNFQIVVKKTINPGENEIIQINKYLMPGGSEFSIIAPGKSANDSGTLPELLNLSDLIGEKILTLNDVKTIDEKTGAELCAGIGILYGFKLNSAFTRVFFPNYDILPMPDEFHNYSSWEIKQPDKSIPQVHKVRGKDFDVKNSIKSDEILVGDGDASTLNIGDYSETIQHKNNENYEVLLYNNCEEDPGCGDESDFHHYYSILKPDNVKDVELLNIKTMGMGDKTGCDTVVLP